jgi:anion-transporting  ArsA/GET3 family ATPase
LFRLLESKRFDKIVLDTPPSSHSISFFDVPQKISRVLEQSVFRALMSKRNSMLLKLTKKLAFFSGGILQNTLERLIGSHFLSELIDFALSIDALYEPLQTRVRVMDNLLKSPTTKYALVVKPTVASIKDSAFVKKALHERGISIHQIIINQVMPVLDHEKLDEDLKKLVGDPSAPDLKNLVDLYSQEVALEQKLIAQLKKDFPRNDRRLLYMAEATVSRAVMLTQLVHDLDKEVHESSRY